MAEKLLNRPDVISGFQQVRGERVPERVAGGVLGDAAGEDGAADGPLGDGLVEVVPATTARNGVAIGAGGGEDPLPGPLPGGTGILLLECAGKLDAAIATGAVLDVLALDGLGMAGEGAGDGFRQKRDPVLATFPVANDDFKTAERGRGRDAIRSGSDFAIRPGRTRCTAATRSVDLQLLEMLDCGGHASPSLR